MRAVSRSWWTCTGDAAAIFTGTYLSLFLTGLGVDHNDPNVINSIFDESAYAAGI